MPASMIMALAGFIRNVSGSSIAMVAGGPRPGMIPTTVPRTAPTRHHSRFAGCNATANPCIKPWRMSTRLLEAEYADRELNAEGQREQDVEPGGGACGDGRGDHQP